MGKGKDRPAKEKKKPKQVKKEKPTSNYKASLK